MKKSENDLAVTQAAQQTFGATFLQYRKAQLMKQSIDEMIRVVRPWGKVVVADEVERLAKQVNRSFDPSSSDQGDGTIETTHNLVPSTIQDIRMGGIWKMHGKYHGYCMDFTKPK